MWGKFRKYFVSGLVVFLPVTLTIYLFVWMLNFTDGLLGKYLEPYFAERFGFYFRGISILAGMTIIFFIGFIVTNYFGRKIYAFFERLLTKIPFFKQVYPAIKEMALFLFARDRLSSFKKVVLLEYPRKGIYAFGFITNDSSPQICEKTQTELYNVFVPSAPGPLTGFVMFVPKDDVIMTDIKVEDAAKFIVSGGVLNP